MSHPKDRFAVGIVAHSMILSFPRTRLTLREASAFARAYNRVTEERIAVVMRHPISRAISIARARSRSA